MFQQDEDAPPETFEKIKQIQRNPKQKEKLF
jgi:hypothetical protein